MTQRTSQMQVDAALHDLTALISSEVGHPVAVTLHRGNGSYKIHNVLIVNGVNVWSDGRAGTTASDAYNALRTMVAGISLVSDIRDNDERKG